jgi:hypothetical protein
MEVRGEHDDNDHCVVASVIQASKLLDNSHQLKTCLCLACLIKVHLFFNHHPECYQSNWGLDLAATGRTLLHIPSIAICGALLVH